MFLLAQMLRKRFSLTLSTVLSIGLLAAITLWWNTQLSRIINTVSQRSALTTETVLLAVFIMIVMCVANCIKTYISGFTCEMLTHDLRMGYARYFSFMPLSEVERLNTGEELSKLQNEIADVSGYLSSNLYQLINDGINFTATLVWLLILNTKLTLGANFPVLIIMLYVLYSSKIIDKATQLSQHTKGQMNKYADTLLTLFPIIQLYDAAHMMRNYYHKEVCEWEHQTVRVERTRARLMSLSGLLSSIPLMLLFLVGGGMVINGSLSVGTLYVFLNLSGNVSGVMMNMPGLIAAFRQFSVNMKRLSYEGNRVLDCINLSVKSGETVGIIGVSGGGKSTLLKLISGLYDVQTGSITIGEAHPSLERRKLVAMVLQSAMLFPASIHDNISCGHSIDEALLHRVCDKAQLSEWINSLPNGLDTFVGERGGQVSGGQAQRIAIARAIAKNAPVILLDEPTSALDSSTGAAVMAALVSLTEGKTVLHVSHQPEMLSDCDRILRLEGGRLYAL